MFLAVIPAAGASRRMGRNKALLPWGRSTVVETVVTVFRTAGVEPVVLVVPQRPTELGSLAEKAGAHVVYLDAPTADMRETTERGLEWIEGTLQPDDRDAWFFQPVDCVLDDPSPLRELMSAWRERGPNSILVPTYAGKRAHPALIGWQHVSGIRNHPRGQGINSYLRSRQGETLEVPVTSPAVLLDLDTPSDYARACDLDPPI